MKPLEALETIKNCDTLYVGCWSDVYTKLPFECQTIEKSIKALEIIKNKNPDICLLKTVSDYQHYMDWCAMRNEITEQEYELLKEILND